MAGAAKISERPMMLGQAHTLSAHLIAAKIFFATLQTF